MSPPGPWSGARTTPRSCPSRPQGGPEPMRYLVFTDIHGNLEALLAVLKFVMKKRIDHYLFLGDLVGYGASPNEVAQKLIALKPLSLVRGNHDKAVCGLDSIQTFNPIAASAIFWTKSRITKKNFDFLYKIKK